MVVPPLVMKFVDSSSFFQVFFRRHPRLRLPFYLAIISASLRCALPLSLAPFHCFVPVLSSDLEPTFTTDAESSILYFNRGM